MRGVPSGAPVPEWLPTLSSLNSLLLVVPVIVIAIIVWKTVVGAAGEQCKGGSFCMVKFGFVAFVFSAFMLIAEACPQIGRLTQFTWFGTAQTQLQLYGFFAITMFGAIYHLLPRVWELNLPFRNSSACNTGSMLGIVILVVSLAVGGVEQGMRLNDPATSRFRIRPGATLIFLRVSTTGLLLILLANLLFALNIFVMILHWKWSADQNCVRRRDGAAGKVGGESMKNGFVIFIAAFAMLFTSWSAFVLGPQLQLGGAKQMTVLNSSDVYPINRPGEANQGLRFIAPTAAPRATPSRCSKLACL